MGNTGEQNRIIIGKIVGLYGVRGWLKVFSYTKPKENIFGYAPWQIKVKGSWCPAKVAEWRTHGKGLIAQIESYSEREQARSLMNAEIAIFRSQLPVSGKGEYYWADLIGLQVETLDGQRLGKVDHLFETGANDVLVVEGERERLIPFVRDQYIKDVDLDTGVIRVDWDPEF